MKGWHILIGNGLVLPAAHTKFGMVKTLIWYPPFDSHPFGSRSV